MVIGRHPNIMVKFVLIRIQAQGQAESKYKQNMLYLTQYLNNTYHFLTH